MRCGPTDSVDVTGERGDVGSIAIEDNDTEEVSAAEVSYSTSFTEREIERNEDDVRFLEAEVIRRLKYIHNIFEFVVILNQTIRVLLAFLFILNVLFAFSFILDFRDRVLRLGL